MNKKIVLSLLAIAVVAAAGIGATIAFFSDTEKSQGNVFTAGSIDLKVDHVRQTYNDVDCKTCSVDLVSDTTNWVVEKSANALLVTNIHPRWTIDLTQPQWQGAKWIWATDPTTQEDVTNNVVYTFRKTFEWWGPITGTAMDVAVGSDNSVQVFLNGVMIGENTSEFGYQTPISIPANVIEANIAQGTNTLEFKVKNWAQAGGTPASNPGGLVYHFNIDGNCGDNFFKTTCKLWGEKDLVAGDTFFNFGDVKPGDRGSNIISLHVYDNDAWACLFFKNKQDLDNTWTQPEKDDGDATEIDGELGETINVVMWKDANKNMAYDDGETILHNGDINSLDHEAIADSTTSTGPLVASETSYLGLAWCLGTQTISGSSITCDGTALDNKTQTDSFGADLLLYTEQHRNNETFNCESVNLQ